MKNKNQRVNDEIVLLSDGLPSYIEITVFRLFRSFTSSNNVLVNDVEIEKTL